MQSSLSSLGHVSSEQRRHSKESVDGERGGLCSFEKTRLQEERVKKDNTPVLLLTSPSAQGTQSKQQIGSPFLLAMREPGGQLSLHTDREA